MLLLKVSSIIPRRHRVSLIIIASQDRIIDMILSERTHQGTELIAFQLYRLYCLDITTGLVSSVSFFSSDLPHESTSLPLFTSISDDFFNSESTQRSHDSLIATTSLIEKMNPFAEEDLRFSMDNQYRVDEEPLVEISHHESISEETHGQWEWSLHRLRTIKNSWKMR